MQGGGAMESKRPGKQRRHLNLRRAGLQKVKDGLTSLEEVTRFTIRVADNSKDGRMDYAISAGRRQGKKTSCMRKGKDKRGNKVRGSRLRQKRSRRCPSRPAAPRRCGHSRQDGQAPRFSLRRQSFADGTSRLFARQLATMMAEGFHWLQSFEISQRP